MLKARNIMTTDLVTVQVDEKITKAAELLVTNRINGLPVVNGEGRLVGIICQSDLISQQKRVPVPSFFTILDGIIPITSMKQIEKEAGKIAATRVNQAMTKDPITVNPDTDIETIASLMVDNNFHTIPVVKDGKLVGIIGKEDILKTLISVKSLR